MDIMEWTEGISEFEKNGYELSDFIVTLDRVILWFFPQMVKNEDVNNEKGHIANLFNQEIMKAERHRENDFFLCFIKDIMIQKNQ